jgi:prolyl 4-hydroxylase
LQIIFQFRRATVQNHKTGALEVAHYRISKSAWLKDDEHKTVRTVSERVEDMTGLTVDTAEELQVVNYGIGGHYEPHYDFARREEQNAFKSLGTGNRIATVLFYVSTVKVQSHSYDQSHHRNKLYLCLNFKLME